MTKSELIGRMIGKRSHLSFKEIDHAVKLLVEKLSGAIAQGQRVEVRGFGSFSLRYRAPRTGRNPKTGASVQLAAKYATHFKPGKELRDRVNKLS